LLFSISPGAPFEFLGTVFLAVGGDIFLGNAKHHGSYFGPDAGTRTHSTRFVRGIQHEVRQIPTIAGGNIFQGFKLHMLDGRTRGLYPVASGRDNHFPFPNKTGDDRTDRIVAPVTGAFCLRDGKLHKLFLRLVGGRNHCFLPESAPSSASPTGSNNSVLPLTSPRWANSFQPTLAASPPASRESARGLPTRVPR